MFEEIMSRQYRRPKGLLGLWVGYLMSRQHRVENRWTVDLIKPAPDEHILEIGFGSGLALEMLAKQITIGKVYGLDFSKAMLATASRRNHQAIRDGKMQLEYGEASTLPFDSASFDKVFSIHSIYFWRRSEKALKEILRVLKGNGKLILTIMPREKMQGLPDEEIDTDNFKAYRGQDLYKLLEQVGFSHVEIISDDLEKNPSNYSIVATK